MKEIDIVEEEAYDEEVIQDNDFYSMDFQEELLENDEESGEEYAFMQGFNSAL